MKLNLSRLYCCNHLALSHRHHLHGLLHSLPHCVPTSYLTLYNLPSPKTRVTLYNWTSDHVTLLLKNSSVLATKFRIKIQSLPQSTRFHVTWLLSPFPPWSPGSPFHYAPAWLLCCPSNTRSTLWPHAPCPYISLCLEYYSSRHLRDRLPLTSQRSLLKRHLSERPFPRPIVLVRVSQDVRFSCFNQCNPGQTRMVEHSAIPVPPVPHPHFFALYFTLQQQHFTLQLYFTSLSDTLSYNALIIFCLELEHWLCKGKDFSYSLWISIIQIRAWDRVGAQYICD